MTSSEMIICLIVALLQSVLYIVFCGYKEKVLLLKKSAINHTVSVAESSDESAEDGEASFFEKKAYNTWQSWLVVIFAIVVFLATSMFLMKNINGWNNYAKMVVLTLVIATAGAVDLKTKRIPNFLILTGLVIRVLIYVYELLYCSEDFLSIFKNDMIGFACGFGILFLAAIISRGSVGFGDVKLFAVIGLLGGAILTYSTLLLALILNTVFSLLIIIVKKKDRKTAVPFGPSIFAGYIIALCLSSF